MKIVRFFFGYLAMLGTPLTMAILTFPDNQWRVEGRIFAVCFVFVVGVFTAQALFMPPSKGEKE